MDHEEYLGHTLAEIAGEKAAIIRPGVIAIVAAQENLAREVILRQCRKVGVEPSFVDQTLPQEYAGISVSLRGRHQIQNASVAIALAEALRERGFAISRSAIVRGLETTEHAGRLELWEGEPGILFDGAHNPASARALRNYLDEFVRQPITMIFGAMRDKALAEIAATLFPLANKLILTELDNPRAATLEALLAVIPFGFDPAQGAEHSLSRRGSQNRETDHADRWIDLRDGLVVPGRKLCSKIMNRLRDVGG